MALRYGARPAARPRVFKAIAYQAKDDPVRAIARRAQPKIAKALRAAFLALRASVPLPTIEARLNAGDPAGAADAVNLATFEHALRPAFEPIADALRAAMRLGAAQMHRGRLRKDTATFSGDPQVPDEWAIDLYSPDVLDEIRTYQDALITSLTDDERSDTFRLILAGMQANDTPEQIAENLKTTVGLSRPLALAIRSYRAGLEGGSASVLNRALRDSGSDAEVRAAIDSGAGLSKERIDKLVLSYANRAVEYRAQMIAQTESNRAANMGLEAAYKQMISTGLMPAEAVRKHWRIALDERTCPICIMYAVAANTGIAIGAAFTGGLGDASIQNPPVHPNCRCSIEIITNLDLVPDTAAGANSEAA